MFCDIKAKILALASLFSISTISLWMHVVLDGESSDIFVLDFILYLRFPGSEDSLLLVQRQ